MSSGEKESEVPFLDSFLEAQNEKNVRRNVLYNDLDG